MSVVSNSAFSVGSFNSNFNWVGHRPLMFVLIMEGRVGCCFSVYEEPSPQFRHEGLVVDSWRWAAGWWEFASMFELGWSIEVFVAIGLVWISSEVWAVTISETYVRAWLLEVCCWFAPLNG